MNIWTKLFPARKDDRDTQILDYIVGELEETVNECEQVLAIRQAELRPNMERVQARLSMAHYYLQTIRKLRSP